MNLGIIGSGLIVGEFVENVKVFSDFHLYGIWGRHEEKIRKFEGFKLYSTNIDEFLDDSNIDVVYVALPNSLHYEYAYKALKAGKHVLLEKPFTQTYKQAKTLADYARKHKLLLFETISTRHDKEYIKSKKWLSCIGDIKLVNINFCNYSRRYDKFKKGEVLPVFDYKLAGGALMDLGVYSIHFIVGLLGSPKKLAYYPNIEKNVDTSGVLVLDYGKFKANLNTAKDCEAPCYALIQGDKGYIRYNSAVSNCPSIDLVLNDGKKETILASDNSYIASWKYLYGEFRRIYKTKDFDKCYEYLKESLHVQKVIDDAKISGKLKF